MYCIYPVVTEKSIFNKMFDILMVQNYSNEIHNVFVNRIIYDTQAKKEYTAGCWRIKKVTLKIK